MCKTFYYQSPPPVPNNVRVGESFKLSASVPEAVKNEFKENNLILGIIPQPDPDEFAYIGPPLNPYETISKEGGKWDWKFKAKDHGTLSIDFRVGVIINVVLTDNCRIPVSISIKNKPFYQRAWPVIKKIFYVLITLMGWLFATVPTLTAWLNKHIAKILKRSNQRKNK